MNNTEHNQYLVKKAQRGLVRFQGLLKKSFDINEPRVTPANLDHLEQDVTNPKLDTNYWDMNSANVLGDAKKKPEPISEAKTNASNPYLRYAIGGAGAGALIGALINLVRKKSLLSGALSGALVGGGLGAGHKYLTDNNETYGNWKNNPIESGFQSGFKAYDDLMSKFNS